MNKQFLTCIDAKRFAILAIALAFAACDRFESPEKQQARATIKTLTQANDSISKDREMKVGDIYAELDVITATANLSNPEPGKRMSDSLLHMADSFERDAQRKIAINTAKIDSLRKVHNIKAR